MTDINRATSRYYLTTVGTNGIVDEFVLFTPEHRPMIRIPFHDNADSLASAQRKADIDLIVDALNACCRDRTTTQLLEALQGLVSTARTFRNVPPDQQMWTSIDDDALDAAFKAIDKAQGYG